MQILFSLIALFIIVCLNVKAQTGNIKGAVQTSDGEPAELVNVNLQGTTIGATTNSKGEFYLQNIEAGKHTLVISFVGRETKEIEVDVTSNETLNIKSIVLNESAEELEEVIIYENQMVNSGSEYVAKIPLKNLDNPQIYNTVSSELMKQQVVTNFDDALKNAPGIERLWESTGRGGDGAAYFSLRGFETQATMVNGLPGLTNGSLDPANIERIEVIKGPSSTLFGSSLISYGGLINTVTKKPYDSFGGEVNYISGSYGLNRASADVNIPLNGEKQVALRLNTAYNYEESFQDAGFRKSFFIAPFFSYQASDRLSFLINLEYISAEGTNPVMLFLNRSNQVEFENLSELNYNTTLSLTSNDLSIQNPRYNFQGFINYKLTDKWTSQTIISRGFAKSDGYYSYLWDNYLENGEFSLYISDQNSETITTDIQQNFSGNFNIGNIQNRVLLGIDYFHRNVVDNSSGYNLLHNVTPQGEINYVDPYSGDTLQTYYLSRQSVDALLSSSPRSNSNVVDETLSAYISDVINLFPELILMASLRVDYFNSEGDITTDEDNFNQTAFSPKFGILYQLLKDKLSLFANYQNGFKNIAPRQVSDINGDNPSVKSFEPEHANQIEFGVKTNLFSNRLFSTISYYNIKLENIVIADPENFNNSIQGGEVESKGFEVDINAVPFSGLNLIAGYSYNDSKILKGDTNGIWFQEGKRPVFSGPQNLFNAWAVYQFTNGFIKGFGIGVGANYASELLVIDSDITGRFTLPSYSVINTSVFYNTADYRLTVNVNNVSNEEYYKGYSTINPQKPRNISVSLLYRF